MATETDFPHRPSIRELRERGWAMSAAGKPQQGLALLRRARQLEAGEAKRIEKLKADADTRHGIKRNQ